MFDINAARKLFEDLDSELKRIDDEYLELYGPAGFKFLVWEGKLYAVPTYFWSQRFN